MLSRADDEEVAGVDGGQFVGGASFVAIDSAVEEREREKRRKRKGEWMSDSGWDEAAVQALVAREGIVRDASAWVESAISEVSGLVPPGWTGAASVAFAWRLDVLEQELRRAEASLDAARQAIGATRSIAEGVG